jgi:hypothetical protein
MAQAWHKQRDQVTLAQGAEARCWRASKYELNMLDEPDRLEVSGVKWDAFKWNGVIEAAPDATWERFAPFDLYEPPSKAREIATSPHLWFLNLKGVREEKPDLFSKSLILFTERYGLLGLFEQDYPQRPITPGKTYLIAPEAVIDREGKLQRVDPAREGKDLLLDLLETRTKEFHLNMDHLVETKQASFKKHPFLNRPYRRAPYYDSIALPSETTFHYKIPLLSGVLQLVDPPTQLVRWEVIKKRYGAFMILDEEAYLGVSILCTRELFLPWQTNLVRFPSSDESVETLASDDHGSFNMYLREVSPRVFLGGDGNVKPGWYCNNLLQAMAVMFYLDLIGGSTVRKCQSRGCPNYFREGSQLKTVYCSEKCANRASTRMARGQEP